MPDLYLICHKVRNAPAFDIAIHMDCPECNAMGCLECDDLGYWWIVPTSGHRAYPFSSAKLAEDSIDILNTMPPDLPDHYPHSSHPEPPKQTLADRLGLNKRPPPTTPIIRRI